MQDHAALLQLLHNNAPEPYLYQHGLASEAIMRAIAQRLGKDAEEETVWATAGLLHDIDYPETAQNPALHGLSGAEKLRDILPEYALCAIRAHNYEKNNAPCTSQMDYALRAAETLTGLIITAALVRPTGIEGMEASSLKKKMKDKAFAASVNREAIKDCEKAGFELSDFLTLGIQALTPLAKELGIQK